jgi:hypothetical protein
LYLLRACGERLAADPAIILMNSRRRIAFSKAQGCTDYPTENMITAGICDWRNEVQGSVCTAAIPSCPCPLWVEADISLSPIHVRFTPESRH